MALSLSRRRRREDAPYWPGFVDAMAQLLLVITFLLVDLHDRAVPAGAADFGPGFGAWASCVRRLPS